MSPVDLSLQEEKGKQGNRHDIFSGGLEPPSQRLLATLCLVLAIPLFGTFPFSIRPLDRIEKGGHLGGGR